MNGRNKELQQELTELVRQRTAISEVLRAIASSPHDMQPIFDTILGSAVRLCRANVGTLRLCEETRLRVVAQLFDPNTLLGPPAMVYEPSSSLLAHLTNGSPVHVSDLDLPQGTLFQDPAIQAIKSAGVRTFLGVPMLAEKRLIGTVFISRVRVEPFTDKEIELIMDFAAQAAIALEITRRERQLRDMQMELAHANRVATIGELTGSIVHEVKQPIAATVTNAQAALRFVGAEAVDLDKVRKILNDIVKDGNRAAEVISRIRDLFKKAPPRRDRCEINGAIREVIELTRGEGVKNGITVLTDLPDHLPHIHGDRVELQQVILNLIINAIQAMTGLTEGVRELHIGTESAGPEGVRVVVRDTGPGLSEENLQRLFEPFYTTKPNGMGMGLSICRSIIEDHGGRLSATGLHPHGALFQFTIPAR
jgi:C4-dicarboxylate-specific signal transduction histidine kinase